MALKATVFKADLNIADMDRGYYRDHQLTIARHPSETDERMMMRLLAFALNAHDDLLFGKGLSTDDEPDLWRKNLIGDIEQWIDVGQPDERRLRKACNRAGEVLVYSYGGSVADIWWQQHGRKLKQFDKLNVFNISEQSSQALAAMVQRTMQLHCTIQEGEVWLSDDDSRVEIELAVLK